MRKPEWRRGARQERDSYEDLPEDGRRGKELAEEKGFDLVLDSSTTLYFKPAMDITADATAAYDKASGGSRRGEPPPAPAKPAAAAPKPPAAPAGK